MQKILENVLKTSETIEDYKDLKENITSAKFLLSNPKVNLQYAEIRVRSK